MPPVGARLAAGEADRRAPAPTRLTSDKRVAETDEPGGDLHVEDAPRQRPGLEQADPQVLAGRVHHDLDRRVVDDVPERVEIADRQRIDHRQPVARRDLDQAEDRLERVFRDELGVEGKPAARPQVLDQRGELRRVVMIVSRRSHVGHQ